MNKEIIHLNGVHFISEGEVHQRTMCGIKVISKGGFSNVRISNFLSAANCKMCRRHRFVRDLIPDTEKLKDFNPFPEED